jgi:hypothetical protein
MSGQHFNGTFVRFIARMEVQAAILMVRALAIWALRFSQLYLVSVGSLVRSKTFPLRNHGRGKYSSFFLSPRGSLFHLYLSTLSRS